MKNSIRKSYHTNIKIAEKLGVLPVECRKKIPKSSRHRFRNTDFSNYVGIELAKAFNENIELLKKLAADENALKVYKVYILIKSIFIKCFTVIPKDIPLNIKQRLVNLVERFRSIIGFEKILMLLNLTKYKFYLFYDQVMHQCKDSPGKLCLRMHPNQLSKNEVEKMQELLTNPEFKGWPVFSIAYYALRQGKLAACVNTWYKYSKILGIERFRKMWHKGKTKGIVGKFIHDIWHADVLIIKLINGVKAYIYLVVENISKFILNFMVSHELSGALRKQTIQEAFDKHIRFSSNPEIITQVLVDGGSENNNECVDKYMAGKDVTLVKIIAQTDISYSNSLIEAVNRTLNQRYLYYHEYADIKSLGKILAAAVHDYNEKCPHISHKGLTPREVLEQKKLDNNHISRIREEARKKRLEENRKANCGMC